MKQKIVTLCKVLFCVIATAIATWNWVHVARLGSEASYMLYSSSMFGALAWWFIDCLSIGGFPFVTMDEAKTSDAVNGIEQTEEGTPI